MSELPVYAVEDLEGEPALDVTAFGNDDAVDLGLIAVQVIREGGHSLAVKIVLRGDTVFLAKVEGTGPGNDEWLDGKAAVASRFGEPSLLVRRRHEAAGTAFADRDDVDHATHRAHGGSIRSVPAASSSERSRCPANRMWWIMRWRRNPSGGSWNRELGGMYGGLHRRRRGFSAPISSIMSVWGNPADGGPSPGPRGAATATDAG